MPSGDLLEQVLEALVPGALVDSQSRRVPNGRLDHLRYVGSVFDAQKDDNRWIPPDWWTGHLRVDGGRHSPRDDLDV